MKKSLITLRFSIFIVHFRSIRRPTTIPIMQHDLKVSSNRQPQQSNNSSKAQLQRQQCCFNNFNSGINNSQLHPSSDGNYHHRNNHQYTSCTSNNCPTHIQHPQHDGEFSRRIPTLDQVAIFSHDFLFMEE